VNTLFRWAKDNKVILTNAGSLIGTTAITSGLGFAYWWLAARRFSPEAVGLASAIIATMTLLGSFAILGMGTLLIGELPHQQGKEFSLISTALILVGGVGGCLGLIYALTVANLSTAFHALGASIGNIILFALGVSLTAVTLVLDQALVGLLRGELQLWRNGLFAVVKLAALFVTSIWLSQVTGLTIYTTWVIGIVYSLVPLVGFAIVHRRELGKTYRPQWGWLRKLGPEALKHHALNLMLDAPSLLLPVFVTISLSATVNAWFYVSWSLSGVANTASAALATTLYAVGAAQPSALARKMRLTLSLALGACVLANCVLLVAPTQVLALFGHSYSEQAAWSLRILSLESFPFIIKNHYIALSRIRGQLVRTTLITMVTGLLELGAATTGAHLGGLNGLSLGWLAAMSIEAIFMSPAVYAAVRSANISPAAFVERDSLKLGAIWLIDTFAQSAVNPRLMETHIDAYQLRLQPANKMRDAENANTRLRPTRLERFSTGKQDAVGMELAPIRLRERDQARE
jgi:O-antigen/teichoic acid export membrane protein